MEDDGRKLRVTVVHPSGRRTFDPASKARLIESCLQPGASVARLALDHGVNANLLWRWIRRHRLATKERAVIAPPSMSAFIPVHVEAASKEVASRQDRTLDLRSDESGARLPKPEESGLLSSPAKVSASLPNGVNLTVECGDVQAVSAMIGALCNVQTGR
ncbi:transposase [Bradyrhizobium viridifuturi]|nr:transposase [Bradyrhizobium viridifuturi]MBR1044986.1 transposase [Bradyrhizobium viridifuturi]MBR1085799.1 transposase [Bradyrhizobium viridifuturi]MBR1096346.1 transposase [Bradyrhizobium viridifuturi]MBR1103428.1 transposase [Bradyrhizobium viridifuturi]